MTWLISVCDTKSPNGCTILIYGTYQLGIYYSQYKTCLIFYYILIENSKRWDHILFNVILFKFNKWPDVPYYTYQKYRQLENQSHLISKPT